MSAFAAAARRNEQGRSKLKQLMGGSVSQTVHNVCSVFRINLCRSPIVDEDGKISLAITRQLKGYIAADPTTTHQKCFPIMVFKKLWRNEKTELAKAIEELTCGALFYGMRSCEYSQVSGEHKTKILQLEHIGFYNNNKEIMKTAQMSLKEITKVTITFHRQKNGTKEADITMRRSNDEKLCPILAWGNITKRILAYPTTDENTPVNCVILNKKQYYIKSRDVMSLIRLTVSLIGEVTLGFGPDDVGTHSIRSSFAMFLYLKRVGDSRIMLQGRWRSLAFMDYIRPQVDEFSAGLSALMTQVTIFYTVPHNMHNDRYYELENNTHDFHPTQHLFRPGQVRRNATANNALPPQNGNAPGWHTTTCLVGYIQYKYSIAPFGGLKSIWPCWWKARITRRGNWEFQSFNSWQRRNRHARE